MSFLRPLLKLVENDLSLRSVSRSDLLRLFHESQPDRRRGPVVGALAAPVEKEPFPSLTIEWRGSAYHATTVADVQRLIREAAAKGRRLRVAGSGHSVPGAVYSSHGSDVRVVLTGDLRCRTVISVEGNGALVSVGGGCYLGVNPSDPTSTKATSLNWWLDEQGWAVPALGGISHQSIAGFMQTGSSGGSIRYGFADAVEAIELVNGRGEVEVFACGSNGFAAAGVAMGLLGVVTNVILRVGPRYFVKGDETNHKQKRSLLEEDESGHLPLVDALSTTDYAHLNWFPQRYVRRVTQWMGNRADSTEKPDPYDSDLKDGWMNVVAAMVLEITNVLLLDPKSRLAQKMVGCLLRQFVPLDEREDFNDAWHLVLPCDDQARVDTLIRVEFTEIWLPYSEVEEAIRRLKKLLKNQAVASNFVVEIYGAKDSSFWLSPSFGRDVVRIDVFWWVHNVVGDAREHFSHFWKVLLDLPGARLHWGKHLPDVGKKYGKVVFDPAYLDNAYDRMKDWRAIRAAADPLGVFATPYWTNILGL